MAGDHKVRARFHVTAKQVAIVGSFEEISFSIQWPRHDQPQQTAQHLSALLRTLPGVVQEGINEVLIINESHGLDDELKKFFGQEEEKPGE